MMLDHSRAGEQVQDATRSSSCEAITHPAMAQLYPEGVAEGCLA